MTAVFVTARRAAGDREPATAQGHRVIAGHDALIAAAEHESEVARGGPPDRAGDGRRPREAAIEGGEELRDKKNGRLGRGPAP